jgi:hypothetical protein
MQAIRLPLQQPISTLGVERLLSLPAVAGEDFRSWAPARRSRLLRRSGCEGWIGEGGFDVFFSTNKSAPPDASGGALN